nr:P2 family phage major capsid protein [Escherichia coli]
MKSRHTCEQVNYDTFISYPQLDTWAAHSDFQSVSVHRSPGR